MMDSLFTAQTGLKASQYSIDVTSNNIANESTEGYKKRIVQTSELSSLESDIGNGVSFDGVRRTTSVYLYSQMMNQNSLTSYYAQQNSTLSSAEIAFSETDESGFSITLNDYFTAIESYRGDPTSSIYKSEVETQTKMMITSINSIYDDLNEIDNDNFSLLEDQVDQVNSILKEITYLNKKMREHGESNDLLDKRDALEKELSNYADIDVSTDSGNYVLKMAGENVIFNHTNLHELSVKEEYISQKDIYTTADLEDSAVSDGDIITITLNNTISIDVTANVSGLPEDELKQQIVDAINNNSQFNSVEAYLDTTNNLVIRSVEGGEDAAFDLKIDVGGTVVQKNEDISVEGEDVISVAMFNEELNLTGGSLKSLTEGLSTATSETSSYRQSLDDLAKALVETYNENSSIPLFEGASVKTLNYLSGSFTSLSNTDLEAIAQIQWDKNINIDSQSANTSSFKDFYEDLLVRVSSNVESNTFRKEAQDAVLNSLQVTYDNITKVDTDQEMINLLQYQSAYEANAKVITTVDEMLQTLLNM